MNWNQELYIRTMEFAATVHSQQKFPGIDANYLLHIAIVTNEVLVNLCNNNADLDIDYAMQCAILHDTIEDTTTTYEIIESKFGNRVAKGVLALTKDKTLPKEIQMSDSLQRIIIAGKEIRVVKMADRICNLEKPPHYWDIPKIKMYYNEAHIIFSALKGVHSGIETRFQSKLESYKIYFC